MFEKLFEKLVTNHWLYKDMKRERDIAIRKFQVLTDEYHRLQVELNNAGVKHKTIKKRINKIVKLVSTFGKNDTTKAIKKLCKEVKENV